MECVHFRRRLFPITLLALYVTGAECCHPNSRKLHVCLNIYLERALPNIQTIIEGSMRGRVLLEGPQKDVQNICSHLTNLYECYRELLDECDTYWQLDRYSRLMNLLNATHSYLCFNNSDIITELLMNTECLNRAGDHIAPCLASGFSWLGTWKEILRMRVAPADRCNAMDTYRHCLMEQLGQVACRQQVARAYGGFLDLWLRIWCNKGGSSADALEYLYQPVAFLRFFHKNLTTNFVY